MDCKANTMLLSQYDAGLKLKSAMNGLWVLDGKILFYLLEYTGTCGSRCFPSGNETTLLVMFSIIFIISDRWYAKEKTHTLK